MVVRMLYFAFSENHAIHLERSAFCPSARRFPVRISPRRSMSGGGVAIPAFPFLISRVASPVSSEFIPISGEAAAGVSSCSVRQGGAARNSSRNSIFSLQFQTGVSTLARRVSRWGPVMIGGADNLMEGDDVNRTYW
jgi:hypothetical protein